MTKMQTDLGALVRNGNEWITSRKIELFGTLFGVEIIVEGNDQNATVLTEQIDMVAFYSLNERQLIAAAEQAITAHYREVVGNVNCDRGYPSGTMVELTGVVFPLIVNRGSRVVGFLLECSWDKENGLAVVFNGDSIEVGSQDLLT